MSYFAVTRSAGPAWTDGGSAAQSGAGDHAAFMNGLAGEGFVHVAGPLAGTENDRLRALLIVDADSEQEIRHRLADDPWTRSEHLQIVSIEPWNMFVGRERLCEHAATASQPQARAHQYSHGLVEPEF